MWDFYWSLIWLAVEPTHLKDINQNENLPQMGVSKNRGTPKWMVYNGKTY